MTLDVECPWEPNSLSVTGTDSKQRIWKPFVGALKTLIDEKTGQK